MAKFTYLIGAGASFNSLPVVGDIIPKMRDCIKKFQSTVERKQNYFYNILKLSPNTKNQIKDDFEDICNKASNFSTIDTYAKHLYLLNKVEQLKKLKKVLSIFFTIEQSYNKVDKRYDSFFATLLSLENRKLKPFPNNITLLSWNYDYQFELSLLKFLNTDNQSEVEDFFNIYPRKNIKEKQSCGLFKLNGTAASFNNTQSGFDRIIIDNSNLFDDITKEEAENELVRRIFNYYGSYNHALTNPVLNFAWEDDNKVTIDVRKKAEHFTSDTEILIVIGYSFPTFNRDIDRKIISNMRNLKKVYLQIPEPDIKNVEQRFRAIKEYNYDTEFFEDEKTHLKKVEIEHITGTDEFFIPFEY